jgi:hypothetical protein
VAYSPENFMELAGTDSIDTLQLLMSSRASAVAYGNVVRAKCLFMGSSQFWALVTQKIKIKTNQHENFNE